jgi:hypothetical protein
MEAPMMSFKEFTDQGLHYPWGIGLGLGIMVLWNVYFIHRAIASAPEVDANYVHSSRR